MKKIIFASIPLFLSIVSQLNIIQQAFGINGSFNIGIWFIAIISFIALIIVLYAYIKEKYSIFPKDISYGDFLDKYAPTAQEIEIIASGSEQLKHFLEQLSSHGDNKNYSFHIRLYIRTRNTNEANQILFSNLKRINKICEKLGIKIKIFEYEWNMMNLSAIIVDNMSAAVNMYLLGEDSITRVWKNYKYIERNKNRSNIEMFKIIDQWKNECSKICRPVEGL